MVCLMPGRQGFVRQVIDSESLAPIGAPLNNSDNVLGGFVFSADNRKLVAWNSANKSLSVWDANTGLHTGELKGHELVGWALAVSPDGTRCVSGSHDKTARLWNLETNSQIGPPMQHQGQVRLTAFSPDGLRIVTGSSDHIARLWDGHTAALIKEMPHGNYAAHADFSPDSKRLVTGSGDRTARIWDAVTGVPIGSPLPHDSTVESVSFSPNGNSIVTVAEKTAFLWDSRTGMRIGEPMSHTERIRLAKFSPDGTRIATLSLEGTVRFWNARDGISLAGPLRASISALPLTFHPDSTRVWFAAQIWEAFPNVPVGDPISFDGFMSDMAISRDGTRIFAAVDKSILAWDSITRQSLGALIREEANIKSIAVTNDGKRFATGTYSRMSANRTASARLWDNSGVPVGTVMEHPQFVTEVVFSPDGTLLASACFDGGVRLWNGFNGAPVAGPISVNKTATGALPLRGLAFRPDGKELAVAASNKVAIYNIPDLDLKQVFPSDRIPVRVDDVAYSSDGTRLVTIGLDRIAHLWDANTGNAIGEPMRHETSLEYEDPAFSPDGNLLVTATDGAAARLWDAWTGVPMGDPIPHKLIRMAAFTPDGKSLITSSTDRRIQFWDISPLPRPKDLAGFIASSTGVDWDETAIASPPGSGRSETLFERESEWFALARERQAMRCRRYQWSAALDAENHKDWFAAEFHLRHLLESEPGNASLKARLQTARENLR